MQIHFGLNNFHATRPVVTIGTFDGLHLGHRAVIAELIRISRSVNGESVVFTFYPHPRSVVSPQEDTIRLLSTRDEKIAMMKELGIDHLVIYPFTHEFSLLSYNDFVRDILVGQMRIQRLVVGYDHKFGHERKGDFNALHTLSEQYNFTVEKLNELLIEEVAVSSSQIRLALSTGDIQKANHYLGYPYRIQGRVIEGNRLGRKLGFPTANIMPSESYKLIPCNGVYAVRVAVEEEQFMGMLNVGTRPTVNTNVDHRSIEVHLLNFDRQIYDTEVVLFFIEKIRDEIKFPGLEALKSQLEKDRETTIQILSSYND